MDLNKIFRVGVDKWYLKNISLKYPPHMKKLEFINDGSLREGLEIRESEFLLSSFTRLTKGGDLLPEVTILTFNPNVILEGHNILNSREGRTIEALEKIKTKLMLKGIELDYSESVVETVEIQRNFNIKFLEIEKSIDLIFSVASKFKSKKTLGDNCDKHLVSNRPSESYWWVEWRNIYRAYDKTVEIKQTTEFEIDLEITRFELKPSSYKLKKEFEEHGLNTNLMSVLNNMEIIDNLFNKFWIQALKKTFKYLEGEYLKNLERAYLSFRDIQKSARKKDEVVPRGIYKWLKDNYEIYDVYYLIEVLRKYNSKNLGREIQIVNKMFGDKKCIENIEYLSNFFSSLNSNNEENSL